MASHECLHRELSNSSQKSIESSTSLAATTSSIVAPTALIWSPQKLLRWPWDVWTMDPVERSTNVLTSVVEWRVVATLTTQLLTQAACNKKLWTAIRASRCLEKPLNAIVLQLVAIFNPSFVLFHQYGWFRTGKESPGRVTRLHSEAKDRSISVLPAVAPL